MNLRRPLSLLLAVSLLFTQTVQAYTLARLPYQHQRTTIGSSLTGDSISITSGKDLNIEGSNVAAEHDISVVAMGEVNIAAATDIYGSDHYSRERTTGLQIQDGFNITDNGPAKGAVLELFLQTELLGQSLT